MSKKTEFDTLIAAYVAGECSSEGRTVVVREVARSPEARRLLEQLQQVRAEVGKAGAPIDHERMVAAVLARVRSVGSARRSARAVFDDRAVGGVRSQTLRHRMWPAFVIATVAIVVGFWVIERPTRQSFASASVYTTGNAERATVTLPDGNMVFLNVASKLEVPADYLSGNHAIRLLGEGLFTVNHHDDIPFTVTAGGTTARVLGTKFLVRHYATDSTTMVSVRDGKVAVRSAILAAARQVVVERSGRMLVQPSDSTQFGFATGVLMLKDVPLSDAIVELDRWYDVNIQLGDPSLQVRRVTGGNVAGSLADLTTILEMTFDVRVVRHGRNLTIFPR